MIFSKILALKNHENSTNQICVIQFALNLLEHPVVFKEICSIPLCNPISYWNPV